MRTLFYGTPAFAVPFLDLLARRTELVGVVSQPDKPAGRRLEVAPTPVKARALELGVPAFQPERPASVCDELRRLRPDLAVAVAYGRILSPEVISLPVHGSINAHFSLLPKFRGAAPVQWSLARGEARTGVTVFWIVPELDAGPILTQREADVGRDEDFPALFDRLVVLGLSALDEALSDVSAGRMVRRPQAGAPSFAPRLKKTDGRISMAMGARAIHDLVRGLCQWPTAYLELRPPAPRHVQVLKTALAERAAPFGRGEGLPAGDGGPRAAAGRIVRVERGQGILIQCSDGGCLWVLAVRPEGRKPVPAADFLNGLRLGVGGFLPLA